MTLLSSCIALVARLHARCALILNLEIPMRLCFAHDLAAYAVACNEEANAHYGLRSSWLFEARTYLLGLSSGLCRRNVPQWYVDSWFREQAHC